MGARPVWGTTAELVEVLDVQPDGQGGYVSVTGPAHERGVVEGSQMLAQALVAASKRSPARRVTSAHMVFARAAAPERPLEIQLDPLAEGRTFTTFAAQVRQGDRLCCPGLLLLDAGAPDVVRHAAAAPDVPGPEASVPHDMGVVGRDLRIVDGAYSQDPDAVGPPEIHAWMRYDDVPPVQHLHDALLAQFTGHLSIGAALRPHRGITEAEAHRTLSTSPMTITLALHARPCMTEWLLFSHLSTSAGDGMTQSECRVHDRDGALVASYAVQAMVRRFADRGASGRDERTTL